MQTSQPSNKKRPGRYALYGAGVLIAVLAIAYFDGGEEPLHPIVQTVKLDLASGGQR